MASSKQILDLIVNKRPGLNFSTLEEAKNKIVFLDVPVNTTISIEGVYYPGDNGASVYQRVLLEPSHDGKFQDIFGFWWELKNVEVTPEMFGAKGDGVTNDTIALQKAVNFVTSGGYVKLRASTTYLIDNLIIPSKNNRGVTIKCNGYATIKANDGGDNNYLIATTSYVNNNPWATWPLIMEGVVVDANDIKDYGCVLNTALSRITRCTFLNANVAGMYLSEKSIDGVTSTPSVVDNIFTNCLFERNNGIGFTNSSNVADFQIIGGNSHSNGTYNMYFNACGGLQISTHTTYSSPNGVYMAGYGFGTNIVGCTFDDDVNIASTDGTSKPCYFGPNTMKDHNLICNLGGDATPKSLIILGCRFQGDAAIHQTYNSSNRTIIIQGGASETEQPIVWNYGGTVLGVVIAENHWNKAANGFINGYLTQVGNTWIGNTAPNKIFLNKPLSASSNTTANLVITLPSAVIVGSILDIKIKAMNIHNSLANVSSYNGTINAGVTRGSNGTVINSHINVNNESATIGSNLYSNAIWSISGNSELQTAKLIITLNHLTPSATGSTMLRIDVDAMHRLSSSMYFE